jgi:septal ring factor EnvC (AmiA/AmiB activator)
VGGLAREGKREERDAAKRVTRGRLAFFTLPWRAWKVLQTVNAEKRLSLLRSKLLHEKSTVFALIFFCSSLFSQAVWSQDFSSIDTDLQTLENLIADTIASTQEQQKLLDDLRANLNESGNLIASYENIIQEQEKLLANLQLRLTEMSETYKTQSLLPAKYARSSKFWRTFTLIAIPVSGN